MGDAEVREFLSYLAEKLGVSAATQNQALNSLVFLYREVLQLPLGKMEPFVRAKRPQNLPIVLTRIEAQSILKHMEVIGDKSGFPVTREFLAQMNEHWF